MFISHVRKADRSCGPPAPPAMLLVGAELDDAARSDDGLDRAGAGAVRWNRIARSVGGKTLGLGARRGSPPGKASRSSGAAHTRRRWSGSGATFDSEVEHARVRQVYRTDGSRGSAQDAKAERVLQSEPEKVPANVPRRSARGARRRSIFGRKCRGQVSSRPLPAKRWPSHARRLSLYQHPSIPGNPTATRFAAIRSAGQDYECACYVVRTAAGEVSQVAQRTDWRRTTESRRIPG